MSIKILYDVNEDRMRLVLQPPDKAPVALWVNRRQWLALLARLRAVAGQLGVTLTEFDPPKVPRGRPPRDPRIEAMVPEKLDGMRLRVEGDGVRLLFVQGEKVRGLMLKLGGLQQLEEIVALQAERAGWDVSAGLERLHAQALTRAAMNRVVNLQMSK